MVHGLSHDMVLVMVDKLCPWLGLQFPSSLLASAHKLMPVVALEEPRAHDRADGHCCSPSDGRCLALLLSHARPHKLALALRERGRAVMVFR